MTPPRPPSPAPQAPPVSQLRRQLVHVNRKVDVLDQLSIEYGRFSASTVPAGHNRLEVEQHEQIGTQGIHLRCSYILIQCRLCRFGFRSGRFERFGPRSVSVPCTFSFFYLQYPARYSRFGLGSSAEGPTEKHLHFLIFLAEHQRGSGTHNPLVPGSSPGGPTICIRFI